MDREIRSRSGAIGAFLMALLAGVACGGGDAGRTAGGGAGRTAGEASEATGLAVCDLLSDEEVTQVMPGHDGGIVTSAGGSLVEGIDVYRCSYTARKDGIAAFDLLNVSVTVAATAELFDQVRPDADPKRNAYDNFAEIESGDGGYTYGDPDEMMVDVWKGTTAVALELVAADAASHTDRLVALAATALSKAN
jgi:hypothetical protein